MLKVPSAGLEVRAATLDEALIKAAEAEAVALSQHAAAQHNATSPGKDVRHLPNKRVPFFGGLEYVGTYVGTVDSNGAPHGLGRFRESSGFHVGGTVLGAGGLRGESGIKYEGQWVHGAPYGYGVLEHGNAEPRSRYLGRLVGGLKDGYGTTRYADGKVPPRSVRERAE
jgi:hypothetical protein